MFCSLAIQSWRTPSAGALHLLLILEGLVLLAFVGLRAGQLRRAEKRVLRGLDLALLIGLFAWALVGGLWWPRQREMADYVVPLGIGKIYVSLSVSIVLLIEQVRLEGSWTQRKVAEMNDRPPVVILASFLILILGGKSLLVLPAATIDGKGLPVIDALFTSTSASCVTGLIPYADTGASLTRFGQLVVLVLIQLGGLGIMVFSTFFLLQLGGMSLRQLQVSREFVDAATPRQSQHLVKIIIASTLAIELVGALSLLPWMRANTGSWGDAIFGAVFHSVSAYCNAGFALYGDSLTGMASASGSMLVVIVLIVLGGLGFSVYSELVAHLPGRKPSTRLSLHSRLVLVSTGVLLVVGALLFYLFERDGLLGGGSGRDQLMHATFQSVTMRTAGFNTVDLARMSGPTYLLFMAWMLIGGSPGSTAGGIKTVTVMVLLLSLVSTIRGREETVIFGRTLSRHSIARAQLITVLAVFVLFVFSLAMLATQEGPFEMILFEVVSAFGTVGVSAGLTGKLTVGGKLMITLLMLLGRLGPLTVMTALASEDKPSRVKYAEEAVAIG